MKGKQDVLKQPEANTDLLYFSALSYYKCSVEKKFPYIYYRISAIGLSCYYVLITSLREISLMYQSNRSFNIPPPGIPRAFDVLSCPGGREFD